MWPFGLATWLWGTIFIDRLNGEKAKETINKTAKTINDRKVTYTISNFIDRLNDGNNKIVCVIGEIMHVP